MGIVTLLFSFSYFSNCITNAPKLRIIRMVFKFALIGEGQHLVVHTCRISDAENRDAMIDQFFANPIDCHIALGTHHHLCFSMERFVDGFNEGRCFSSSRRTMHNRHIFCPKNFVDCFFLCWVKPREGERIEFVFLRCDLSRKNIA